MESNNEKVKSIISDVRTCMFITQDLKGKPRPRPMSTNSYDADGNIWFFTDRASDKVNEIKNNPQVILTYSIPADDTFLSINAQAEIVEDLDKKEELFNFFAKAWFPDGHTSPNLALIKIIPDYAEYWDSPDWKVFQLFKMAKAVLTNQKYETEVGEHTKVKL